MFPQYFLTFQFKYAEIMKNYIQLEMVSIYFCIFSQAPTFLQMSYSSSNEFKRLVLLVLFFFVMDYQLFYLLLMEKREELLWRKLRVQITPNHQNMRLRRASTDGLTHYQVPSSNTPHDQSSQIASPTFRKHYSIKSEAGQEGQQSFSFGEQMLYDIQHMLKLPNYENHYEKNYLAPACAQCQTMCTSRHFKMVPRAIVEQIAQKMSNFVVEAKYLIKALKLCLNSCKESFESEKQYWENSLLLILGNLQSKKQHQKMELQQKISKMQQQNYFNGEKYKILEKKTYSLEHELSQLINNLNIERINNEALNKKIFQINQQLHSKIAQNTKLLQANCSLKFRLTNYVKNNIDQISQLPPTVIQKNQKTEKIDKFGLQLNQLGGFRSKFSKSQYDTGSPNSPFQVPLSARQCFPPEFTESLTFSNVKNEEKIITSPILKTNSNLSNNSGKILQQKQKNCHQLTKLLTQPKFQFKKGPEVSEYNSRQTSRKNSSHSIISQFAQRRGSLNMDYDKKGQEDKNRILDKIKKLKEDISTQINDLNCMKKDKY